MKNADSTKIVWRMPAGRVFTPTGVPLVQGRRRIAERLSRIPPCIAKEEESDRVNLCSTEPVASNSKDFLNKPGRYGLVLQSKWDLTVQRTANPAPLLPTYPSNQIGLCSP